MFQSEYLIVIQWDFGTSAFSLALEGQDLAYASRKHKMEWLLNRLVQDTVSLIEEKNTLLSKFSFMLQTWFSWSQLYLPVCVWQQP